MSNDAPLNFEEPNGHHWWCDAIAPPCEQSRQAALLRQHQLTKPQGSLGRLEQLAVDFAGWQATSIPSLERVSIRIFAADHGVVATEPVSAFPQAVTAQMIRNFSGGGAAINVLARQHSADFAVINLGTVEALESLPQVVDCRIAAGTANFCVQPAMTESQLHQALNCGAQQVDRDAQLFVGGEMGIGNTTSAAALMSGMLNLPAEHTVGRGTGVDDKGLSDKRRVVSQALALHQGQNVGSPSDCVYSLANNSMSLLQRVGGFEIAGLVGAYVAAAQRGVPSLVDGYICSAAALVACGINPTLRPWLVFSHCSAEAGHRRLLESMDATPLLDLGLRLGEGSGAALCIPLLRDACALHANMATFASASISGKAL